MTSKSLKEWARRMDATVVARIQDARDAPPEKKIAFETTNFGWILSEVDPKTGLRKILERR